MQYRTILHILGVILLFIAAAMGIPALLALVERGPDAVALCISTGITFLAGAGLFGATGRSSEERWLTHRDGYLATILGWLFVMLAMIMVVFERIREIGILRALGWTKRKVSTFL